MSLYITLDGEIGDQVASNRGWGDFGRWVDALDAETYPQVIHLYDHGWTQNVGELRRQLSRALATERPAPDVASIASAVLDAVQDRAGVVTISDGMAPG